MNVTKEIERHRLPCGAATIAIDGVCRRRLRDHFDSLLDKLTQETNPEGVDKDILEMEEQADVPEEGEQQETAEEKRARMLEEGKMKIDVKRELAKYEAETSDEPEVEEEEEESDDEMKKRLVKEGKLKADVKKEVQKYEDKIMPKPKAEAKPKPKAKSSNYSESEEEELQGNSKLLQDITGKIKKR